MYAIIRAGGHQEKVAPGEQITVDRLKQEVGEEVSFTPLVISKADGSVVSDKKVLEEQDAAVVGRVVQHLKGDKVDIFMYRNKTNYRRHTGHRQPLTLVEIAEIRLGGDVAKAPEAVEEPAPVAEKPEATEKAGTEKAATEKAAAKKGPAKQPAAKKSAAKKGPSAKKSTAKKASK